MKIVIIKDSETISTELEADNIQTVLSLLKLNYGKELTDCFLFENYKYVLSSGEGEPVQLDEHLTNYTFKREDKLMILKDVGGEIPAALLVAAWGAVGVTTVATSGLIAVTAFVVNAAISFGLSAIMNALSPTPEFNSDPSGSQKTSNLFNGGFLSNEQGGSVPFVFGNCYAGGVVISSGVSTSEE